MAFMYTSNTAMRRTLDENKAKIFEMRRFVLVLWMLLFGSGLVAALDYPYAIALEWIEAATRDSFRELDLLGLGLPSLPPEIAQLTYSRAICFTLIP